MKPTSTPSTKDLRDLLWKRHQRVQKIAHFDPTAVNHRIEEFVAALPDTTAAAGAHRVVATRETRDFFSRLARSLDTARREVEVAAAQPNFVRNLVVASGETDDDGMHHALQDLSARMAGLQAMSCEAVVLNHVSRGKPELRTTSIIIRRLVDLYESVTGDRASAAETRPYFVEFAQTFFAHLDRPRRRSTLVRIAKVELRERRNWLKAIAPAVAHYNAAVEAMAQETVTVEPEEAR